MTGTGGGLGLYISGNQDFVRRKYYYVYNI